MAKSQGAAGASPCTSLLTPLMRINKFLHQQEFIFCYYCTLSAKL